MVAVIKNRAWTAGGTDHGLTECAAEAENQLVTVNHLSKQILGLIQHHDVEDG